MESSSILETGGMYVPLPQQEFTKSKFVYVKKTPCQCGLTEILCGISFTILVVVIVIVVMDSFRK